MKSKKRIDFIIKNRFIIAICLVLVFSIIGYIKNISNTNLEQWITNTSSMWSLWCNLKFFALLLSGYELFLLITNDNKYLSISGAIVLGFSSSIAYNFTKIDSLVFGSLIIVLLNNMLNGKSKLLNSILIIILSICYSYTFIPYAISFGYLFLSLIIFVIIKNRKNIKDNKNLFIYLILCVIISTLGIIISKKLYKNEYTEVPKFGVNGFNLMFSYLYSLLLPFFEINNKEFLSSIIGLCPLPIIVSLYYIYKNEKHVEFLLPVTFFGVLGLVFCLSGFPAEINRFLMLQNVEKARMITSVQLANLFIIYYFIANIDEKLFSTKIAIRITLGFLILLAIARYPAIFSNRIFITLYAIENTLFTFLFLNTEDKSYKKVFVMFLLLFTLIGGVPVYFIT